MPVTMKYLIVFLALIGYAVGKDWWEGGNFYQVYPRSFKDSDGDGIGDLKGIAEKLGYLKELGVTAAWLSPIFKSPMVDSGYDISDYKSIQPEYGTIDDFLNLMRRAKEIGLKIIMDLVPNHTSDQSEWFAKSIKRIDPYTDYYIWHDGKIVNGQRVPPNNWVSNFSYSAWEWNEERQQYYLHQFSVQQPDLNFRNPKVRQEMADVMRFWMDKGVDGFRIDAVPFMVEVAPDENGDYPDEPVDPACPNPNAYCHTYHIYTNSQPETYGIIFDWQELLREYTKEHGGDTRIMMTESYTTFENSVKFYGDGVRNGSQIPFNFEFIKNLAVTSTGADFSRYIDSWLALTPPDCHANWVLGNHDQRRVTTRYGYNRADLLNIMVQTLPGIAITYNGEEIVMEDGFVSWDRTVDPQACNSDPDNYQTVTRDPARTPFQWDDSVSAGFSTNPDTWLPVAANYKANNVALQEKTPRSHLNIFKKLVRLRQNPSFQGKSYERVLIGENILLYKRESSEGGTFYVLLNFGKEESSVDISKHFNGVAEKLEVITTSLQSKYEEGQVVSSKNVVAYVEVGTVFASL